MKTFKEFLGEGYTLKRTSVEKYNEPQLDDYTDDINGKHTSYDIIHNKTGEKIGTAHHDTNDYFGPSERLRIKLHSGIDRDIATKGNPQSSFNHYVKKYGAEKLTPKKRGKVQESISESEVETVKMGPYGEGIPAGHIYNTAFGSKVDATGYAKYAISKGSKAVIGVRDGMHHVHHTQYADLNEWRKSDHFKNYFASLKK